MLYIVLSSGPGVFVSNLIWHRRQRSTWLSGLFGQGCLLDIRMDGWASLLTCLDALDQPSPSGFGTKDMGEIQLLEPLTNSRIPKEASLSNLALEAPW